ncbi:AmmeMemoRadiSam system radical SAM enzyme [Candidatus Micrarchaeota archaeon]|nr:AmmeMemoRadiSam system radical SAM enzyme [Candidatus Micrarchaeota archaeon]
MKEAMCYTKQEGGDVQCYLCRRMCRIKPGETGYCHVRENRDGTLYTLPYGKAVAVNVDPVEKKPFYHFMPGADCFSFSTVGCNFRCKYCQNWEISQAYSGIVGEDWPPEKIVEYSSSNNISGIAYTYTEPTIFMEYALDTAKLAHQKDIFNVFVTNGYESDAAISEMAGRIDASRIDLKGFNEKIYRDVCGDVELEGVLATIKGLYKIGHIEIINLVVPGYNDDEDDLRAVSKWCAELDPNVPLHFIGFYPANKMEDVPSTKLDTLLKAREIAMDEGVKFAYSGNRMDEKSESTYCPKCGEMVVCRRGFGVVENKVDGYNKCPECGEELYFVNDINEYWRKNGKRND